MEMRVTLSSMVNQALTNTNQTTAQLAQLQAEASTGSSLVVPSDGPAATVSMLAAQAQNAQYGTYLSNIQSATATLNASASTLQSVNNILTQAQTIALQGAQSTNTTASLNAMADQVDQLLNQLLNAANSKSGNDYLFAGAASQTQPFVVSSENAQGLPQTISYQGSADPADVIIGPQGSVQTLYTGSQVFQSTQRGSTLYQGDTGAAAGQGTDSATGQGTLQVRHTVTSYASGSGVTAGTASAAGDTILGPAGSNTLTVVDTSGNGTAGTVSLNGGPTVNWTNTDTNLEVDGMGGQVVFLNTTGITAGFNGSVAATSSGTLSVDGGQTTVPINYSANQVVTNGTTGAVTNVDSSGIRTVGDDQLNYQGTDDAFQVLMALRDDLRNTAGMNSAQQIKAISSTIGELQRVSNSVLESQGQQSAALQSLQSLQTNFQNVQLAAQQLATNLGGANIANVTVQLQAQQNQLEFTLEAISKVMSVNLVDFLH